MSAGPTNNVAEVPANLPPEPTKETGGCLKRLVLWVWPSWRATRHWFVVNTFAPGWLPRPLCHPLVSYLLAVLLPILVTVLDLFLAENYPDLFLQRLPFVLVVVVMALSWGLGPSLVAACWGTFLIHYVVRPPHFSWAFEAPQDVVGVVLFLLISLAVATLASRKERARRQVEELAASLEIERERLQQEFEKAQANEVALRQANQRVDEFLGMASHELKTPLTTVILGLQVVQRRVQHLLTQDAIEPADLHKSLGGMLEHLRRVDAHASRLDRLVNDLLEVSRIQAGKMELRPKPTNLVTLVQEVVEELHQALPARTITLCGEGQDAPVLADAGRVGQVVLNYLTNALKYSAEDCPVEVGVQVEEVVARVKVCDAGPGIPAEELERIWERFHCVPGIEVQSGSGIGLGLGLYISRTIIERHGGHVGVESTPGVGSTFWFTLPLASER
jgi:signal transduction histidine kinase